MKVSNLIMLLCGAVLIASCKNSSSYKALNNESSDTALVAAGSTAPNQQKLVKTADINFKVKNVPQTCEKVSALTEQYRGIVVHNQMRSEVLGSHDVVLDNDSVMQVAAFSTTANMTLRVPTEKLDDLMNQISRMSMYVSYRKMDIEDKTLDYLEAQLKLNSRNELVKQQKAGRLIINQPGDVLQFKDELVDQQISNRRIDDAVKYSVITLSFNQSNTVTKEIIANDDITIYNIPFFSRLALAIANGLQMFGDVVLALVNLWVFIAAGLLVWFLISVYRKKKGPLFTPQPLINT